MNEYTHIGILFNKSALGNNIILRPIAIVNCNLSSHDSYDVEYYGNMEDISCYTFDDLSDVVGFVTPKDNFTLDEINNLSMFDDLFNYLFIQTYNYESDKVSIYKVDTTNNRLVNMSDEANKYNIKTTDYKRDSEIEYVNESLFVNKNSYCHSPSTSKVSETKDNININFDFRDLYKYLKERIVGQDDAIKKILSTLDRNYNISNYRNKTNIFLIGPSGSGKTEIFRTIAEKVNIPITIEDSEQYSAVGYVGANIEDMLVKLYHSANGNLELAQKGILVIDEIDKKISRDKDDVSGNRILNSLLSLMEGTNFKININGTNSNARYVNFNTNYLTVILLGACSDLISTRKHIGFNNQLESFYNYDDIDIDKLKKYGFSSELLRRVSIFRLNNLSIDNLIEIMLKSANSALGEYYKYASLKNINLKISDDAIREIARISYNKMIGASGIKDTLNEILNDAFFEINMNDSIISDIIINKDTLNKKPPYMLIKKK